MPRPDLPARPRAVALAAVLAALLACALGAPAGAAARVTLGNWDRAQQRAVVHAGLLYRVGSSFAGATPISSGQTDAAMAALAARVASTGIGSAPAVPGVSAPAAPAPVTVGSGAVTVVAFDRAVVAQLGLSDVAAHVQSVAVRPACSPRRTSARRWSPATSACDSTTRPAPTSSSSCRPIRSPAPRRPGRSPR